MVTIVEIIAYPQKKPYLAGLLGDPGIVRMGSTACEMYTSTPNLYNYENVQRLEKQSLDGEKNRMPTIGSYDASSNDGIPLHGTVLLCRIYKNDTLKKL